MGKHHTYRKRGTAKLAQTPLPHLPPADTANVVGYLTTLTNALNNSGGNITIYYALHGPPWTWVFYNTDSWHPTAAWNLLNPDDPPWWKSDQTGNGIDWAAETIPGTPWHYIPD